MGSSAAAVSAPNRPSALRLIRVVECSGGELLPRGQNVLGEEAARQRALDMVKAHKGEHSPTIIEKRLAGGLQEISVVITGRGGVIERVAKLRSTIRGESFVEPQDWRERDLSTIVVMDRATAEAELVPLCPG